MLGAWTVQVGHVQPTPDVHGSWKKTYFQKYIILAPGCFEEGLPTNFTSFVESLARAGILKDQESDEASHGQGAGCLQDAANAYAAAVQKDDVDQSGLELLCGAIMEDDSEFNAFFDLDAVGFVNGKSMRCPAML